MISGPSGSGKSTITASVLEQTAARFSVSMTTRSPRAGEVNGESYHFVTQEEFEEKIANDGLLEWAEVFGNYYGTPSGPVQQAIDAGETMILEIDIQGGLQVATHRPDATFVLITPPSLDELKRRLAGRGTEDAATVDRRFSKAQHELNTARESGVYTREVVNDNLDHAIEQVTRIIEEQS